MKKITTITLLASSIFFAGCDQSQYQVDTPSYTPKPAKKVAKVAKDQKLHIGYKENTTYKNNIVKAEKEIALNNLNKKSVTLNLQNLGDKPLKITSISLVDNNNMFKIYNNNCDTTKELAKNKSCEVTVSFLGEDDARYHSMLTIKSNDKEKQLSNILISGISENKYKASLTAKTEKKVISRDLELKFNASDATQYITVSNNGIETLQLGQLKLIGPDRKSFQFDSQCQKTLAVGKNCEVTVKYKKDAKDGHSIAQLYIPSNGQISPSSKTRLIGYSKPFYISLDKFVVSKNVKDFMEDYFTVKKNIYIRTIYQNNVDLALESYINKKIKNGLIENGIKITSNAAIADKIITIYPTVNVINGDKATNDMTFAIKLNGYLSTKSTANGKIKTQGSNIAFTHNMSVDQNSSSFNSISVIDKFIDKEEFEYGMKIMVNNAADKYEVYNTVADMIANKLFNVVGITNRSGK